MWKGWIHTVGGKTGRTSQEEDQMLPKKFELTMGSQTIVTTLGRMVTKFCNGKICPHLHLENKVIFKGTSNIREKVYVTHKKGKVG